MLIVWFRTSNATSDFVILSIFHEQDDVEIVYEKLNERVQDLRYERTKQFVKFFH